MKTQICLLKWWLAAPFDPVCQQSGYLCFFAIQSACGFHGPILNYPSFLFAAPRNHLGKGIAAGYLTTNFNNWCLSKHIDIGVF
jgi:hypothetical protein